MGKYIAEQAVKLLIAADISIKNANVGCLGITFKEDCPDARNSKVNDMLKERAEYGIKPIVCDPVADAGDVRKSVSYTHLDVYKRQTEACRQDVITPKHLNVYLGECNVSFF